MARIRNEIWKFRRAHRSADGMEYYSYPSPLALKYFYHVHSIGQATLPPGYRFAPSNRSGFLVHYTHRGVAWCAVRGGPRQDVPTGSACLMDCSENRAHGNAGSKTAHVWWVLF